MKDSYYPGFTEEPKKDRQNCLRNERGWNMHNSELLKRLGIQDGRLPDVYMPPIKIQNFRVYVISRHTAQLLFPNRTRPHRIIARCLICNWEGSAGRTHQHKCTI